MKISHLHHVSLAVTNLENSAAFYMDVFGMRQITRPPLKSKGIWLSGGSLELHLISNPAGSFRQNRTINSHDFHFAIRVEDFEAFMAGLAAKGFREAAPEGDPLRITIDRKSLVGYPQAYLLDPDNSIIEINAAS